MRWLESFPKRRHRGPFPPDALPNLERLSAKDLMRLLATAGGPETDSRSIVPDNRTEAVAERLLALPKPKRIDDGIRIVQRAVQGMRHDSPLLARALKALEPYRHHQFAFGVIADLDRKSSSDAPLMAELLAFLQERLAKPANDPEAPERIAKWFADNARPGSPLQQEAERIYRGLSAPDSAL